jgi:hypothetical protein
MIEHFFHNVTFKDLYEQAGPEVQGQMRDIIGYAHDKRLDWYYIGGKTPDLRCGRREIGGIAKKVCFGIF